MEIWLHIHNIFSHLWNWPVNLIHHPVKRTAGIRQVVRSGLEHIGCFRTFFRLHISPVFNDYWIQFFITILPYFITSTSESFNTIWFHLLSSCHINYKNEIIWNTCRHAHNSVNDLFKLIRSRLYTYFPA